VILLLQLYARPFSAMSRILDEGRLVLALAVALGAGFLVQFMLPSRYILVDPTPEEAIHARAHAQAGEQEQPPASNQERPRRRSLPLPIGPFSALASIGFVFVPASILLVNLWDRLGGAGVILRRDYLPVLLCVVTAWIAAILPLTLVAAGNRFAGAPLPSEFIFGVAIAAGLYFLFLSACALRTAMGTTLPRALAVIPLAAVAGAGGLLVSDLSRGALYYLASPFFLYYAWALLQTDLGLIGSGLRSRQSFRRQMEISTLNPRDADAHYQLGLIYQQRRQYDQATGRFRKAIEIAPDEADAFYQLGLITRAQGKAGDALPLLQRAAALDDKLAASEVWREIGVTELQLDQAAEAHVALAKYVDRRPYDPEGLYWFGKVLRKLGRNDEAAGAFRQAVEAVNTMPQHRKGRLRTWGSQASAELKSLR
jgi:tetratricopeptide (TPR) repeat protein